MIPSSALRVPEKWYKISQEQLARASGPRSDLTWYNQRLPTGLTNGLVGIQAKLQTCSLRKTRLWYGGAFQNLRSSNYWAYFECTSAPCVEDMVLYSVLTRKRMNDAVCSSGGRVALRKVK